jgi:hypothetical protein
LKILTVQVLSKLNQAGQQEVVGDHTKVMIVRMEVVRVEKEVNGDHTKVMVMQMEVVRGEEIK